MGQTVGYTQEQEKQIRFIQNTSKRAYPVLDKNYLDKLNQDELVTEWQEEKSIEKD